jgi:lysozyme
MLPPALDVEFGGNCSKPPPREQVRAAIFDWLARVEQRVGQRPMVYVTAEAFAAFFEPRDFSDVGATGPLLWYRSLIREPALPYDARARVWQYWSRGRVAGISTPVDLNLAGRL